MPGAAPLLVILAFVILAWQSIEVSDSFARVLNSPLWLVPHFAWSGLLFSGGYRLAEWARRQSARDFVITLFANTYMPLIAAVVLTALVLGPLVSANPIFQYFGDSDLWNYFLNLVAWPQFTLPGVFEFNNLSETVNEGLWAVPCLALAALAAFWRVWLGLAIIALVIGIGALGTLGFLGVDGPTGLALAGTLAAQAGVLAFRLRDRVRIAATPAGVAGAALAAAAYLGRNGGVTDPASLELVAILSSVVVAFAGRRRMILARFSLAAAPYLVPALLVSFPVQQVASSSSFANGPIANLIVTFPVIAIAAVTILTVTRLIARRIWPGALVDLHRVEIAGFRAAADRTRSRRRRRQLTPLLLVYLALIIGTLVVLSMTVFALRQNPWEN